MKEKRKVERFDLQTETIVNVQNEAIMDKIPILISRDISCSGVFLTTENPLPINTMINLDILLNHHKLSSGSKEKRINISTSGKVVRKDDQGMAVKFDELFKVSHLKRQP